MNTTMGVLLLAAATAGDGFGYTKPGVGLKKLFRPAVVVDGPAPPGGMINGGMPAGCGFGHPGCGGGATCPGAGGAGGGAGASNRRFATTKSQLFFLDPSKMTINWQSAAGPNGERVYGGGGLTVPARYNFNQGYIYRLKVSNISGREGVTLYPTIEVAPSAPATDAYLAHNPIPVQFTAEDFDQVVDGGNFVTKVIYLPDPKYQELAIAGVETLVSTRLEPGVDPILEADKRGTILLIVRLGAIDLEMPEAAATATTTSEPMAPATPAPTVPPAALPPGVVPTPPPAAPVVPVDTAPVNAAPAPPAEPAAAPAPAPTTPPAPEPAPTPAPAPAPAPAAPGTAALPPLPPLPESTTTPVSPAPAGR